MAPLLRQQLRKQLAMPTTTIAICLLGLAGGILAALMIAGFALPLNTAPISLVTTHTGRNPCRPRSVLSCPLQRRY